MAGGIPSLHVSAQESKVPTWLSVLVVITLTLSFVLWTERISHSPWTSEIGYPEFRGLVRQDKVFRVVLQDQAVAGVLNEAVALGSSTEMTRYFTTRIPSAGDPTLRSLLEEHEVAVMMRPIVSPI